MIDYTVKFQVVSPLAKSDNPVPEVTEFAQSLGDRLIVEEKVKKLTPGEVEDAPSGSYTSWVTTSREDFEKLMESPKKDIFVVPGSPHRTDDGSQL